ncbi:hypothetical protein [Aerosakkonema funiforme]|uniref:hypothetical protein n=1 Tax=Aerosakkonema funiforme TaxID=1246630 RepID=UPI0035B75724
MFQHPLLRGWFRTRPYFLPLAAILLMMSGIVTFDSSALAKRVAKVGASPSKLRLQKALAVPTTAPSTSEPEQVDPLDSPHPIPWKWILTTQDQISANKGSGVRFYRTPSLVSPDGQYAAYSRIQIQVQPEMYNSRVSSVMFVENLATGNLRVVSASSPLANNPLKKNEPADMPGVISIMTPVSWSQSGDRLLARQFEGTFNSSDASDYAVVWDKRQNRANTVAPSKIEYSQAVLLGWSQTKPDQVLFRAGELGNEKPPLWAVNLRGQTVAAKQDQPVVFGRSINHTWAGPQRPIGSRF